MKPRAEVFKATVDGATSWHLDVWITSGAHTICAERTSWAIAMADELVEVGLVPAPGTNPSPMEAP